MSEKVTNIAKNTSYFTLALILQKVISFSYFTILARNFAPIDLGKYYFAISFTTIFSIFMDMGLANVLTREAAKNKNRTEELLRTVIAIKLPLAFLSLLATVIIINFLNYPPLTKNLVYLSTICMTLDSFTLIFFSTIRASHNLKYESISSVVYQLIALVFGITILSLKIGLIWQMTALILASVFNIGYSFYLLKFKWKLRLKPIFKPELIKYMVGLAIAFGIYGILQRLYTYFDTVLLSILAGDYYVGIYQVAFKLINALQFLPMAFAASLYPALASYWASNRQQLSITFQRAMNYLIIISLPISVGIITLADKIVLIFKSGYSDSILPMQINIIALIFLFINFPIGSLLNACDRQKINTLNMGIVLLVSLILNIILIPKFQAVGAAITVLITNILMFILGILQVPKITTYEYRKIIIIFLKTLLAAAVMGLAAVYLKAYLNIFTVVIISALIYFALIYFLKGFKREDILSIAQSFKK